ncbi:MAG: polymer-forming cytoskeletal protein [Vicinamibacteria bacterium]
MDDKATVIDAHGDFEGKLKGKDVHVFGRFRGEIEVTGRVILGEGSKVDAHIVADVADIAGELKGQIKVRSLVLQEKARIEGTVDTQVLNIREGAQLNGAVNTGAKDTPKPAPAPAPAAVPAPAPKPAEEVKAG